MFWWHLLGKDKGGGREVDNELRLTLLGSTN